MTATFHHQVALIGIEADAFVFAGTDKDFKVARDPNAAALKLGCLAVVEERSDGAIFFKNIIDDVFHRGEIRGDEFWLEQSVQLRFSIPRWMGHSELGLMTLHKDVVWPDGQLVNPCVKVALVKRLELPVEIDKQMVRWQLMEFRPNLYKPPVCDTPSICSTRIPTVTWDKEVGYNGTVERVGIVARVLFERGSHVAYIFTPNNFATDPVIFFPNGAQPLRTKQWIIFRAPSYLTNKYRICEYRCIEALMPTKDFSTTIKVKVEDMDVPVDINHDRVLVHELLGGIYDPNGLLRPGENMSFVVLRRKPDLHPKRIHCKWFVSLILEKVKPIVQVLPQVPFVPDEPEIHQEETCSVGWSTVGARSQMEIATEIISQSQDHDDVVTPPEELPHLICKKTESDIFVTEEVTQLHRYIGPREGCDGAILVGHIMFHVKRETLAWRYPDFGRMLEKGNENGQIWKLDADPKTVQGIFDLHYDHELKDDDFLKHGADIEDFWKSMIDMLALLAAWKMGPIQKLLVKEALRHHCSDNNCWRCVSRVALAALTDIPYPATITPNALHKWKENCLPILQQSPFVRIILEELVASVEKKVE